MKKALWLIAALVLALVLVTGCEQESIEISKLPSGSDNFDFEGKTLVQLTPTPVLTINKFSIAGASSTTDTITLSQTTRTYAFAEGGTYTKTTVTSYTPAADGRYVNGAVAGVGYDNEYYLTGFANKIISQTVETGTWYQFKDKNSWQQDVTKMLMKDELTSTLTSNGNGGIVSGVTLITYAAGVPSVTITNNTDPVSPLSYEYAGETADGRDVWDISGTYYVEQE